MENNEFNFYNSENDGYRGSFGEYVDPTPRFPIRKDLRTGRSRAEVFPRRS